MPYYPATSEPKSYTITSMMVLRKLVCTGIILFSVLALPMLAGKRIKVTILEQRDTESQYSGVIPGHTNATSNTNVNCSDLGSNVNCNGTTRTTATTTPARRVSYGVSGSTPSLQLPDGRITVVNCDSK